MLFPLVFFSCKEDPEPVGDGPTPYEIEYPYVMETYLPPINVPHDNPMTVEGVELGRQMFYEKKLSGTNTMSCSSCHFAEYSFTDNNKVAIGHEGVPETRNVPVLVNLGWMDRVLWDGRAKSIFAHGFLPVTNPIEMHNTWANVEKTLNEDPEYPALFKKAFGTDIIDSILIVKALNQFERTMISGNAPFDKYQQNIATGWASDSIASALRGFDIFMDETKGDCFHCHGDVTNPLWTDNLFHNTGLDIDPPDPGLAKVTGNPADLGKFKTPTLRNLVFTAPYMHDGRFATLEEVVSFYSTGVQATNTIDPLMKRAFEGGVHLTGEEEKDLVMFLKSLSDSSYIENPKFQKPQ